MKVLFIISSILVVSTNAEDASPIIGRHMRDAERRGAKPRATALKHRRARVLTSKATSAPTVDAEASISMPTRFVVPAEFILSMPESVPAADSSKARKLYARRLTESMSMSAPIFEAEASISMPTRFVVPAEFSLSMPAIMSVAGVEEAVAADDVVSAFSKGSKRKLYARSLTESMSMSAPIFEAEASISMPTRFVVPAEFSLSMPAIMSVAGVEEADAADDVVSALSKGSKRKLYAHHA